VTEIALLHDFTALYDKSGQNNTFLVVLVLVLQQNGFFCDPYTPFTAVLLLSAFPTLGDGFLTQNICLHSCLSNMVVERKIFSISRFFKRAGLQQSSLLPLQPPTPARQRAPTVIT